MRKNTSYLKGKAGKYHHQTTADNPIAIRENKNPAALMCSSYKRHCDSCGKNARYWQTIKVKAGLKFIIKKN